MGCVSAKKHRDDGSAKGVQAAATFCKRDGGELGNTLIVDGCPAEFESDEHYRDGYYRTKFIWPSRNARGQALLVCQEEPAGQGGHRALRQKAMDDVTMGSSSEAAKDNDDFVSMSQSKGLPVAPDTESHSPTSTSRSAAEPVSAFEAKSTEGRSDETLSQPLPPAAQLPESSQPAPLLHVVDAWVGSDEPVTANPFHSTKYATIERSSLLCPASADADKDQRPTAVLKVPFKPAIQAAATRSPRVKEKKCMLTKTRTRAGNLKPAMPAIEAFYIPGPASSLQKDIRGKKVKVCKRMDQ